MRAALWKVWALVVSGFSVPAMVGLAWWTIASDPPGSSVVTAIHLLEGFVAILALEVSTVAVALRPSSTGSASAFAAAHLAAIPLFALSVGFPVLIPVAAYVLLYFFFFRIGERLAAVEPEVDGTAAQVVTQLGSADPKVSRELEELRETPTRLRGTSPITN